jgi:hypothetical protein
MEKSPSLCILPWASISIGTRGEVLRCQMSRESMGHLGSNNLDEILDNSAYTRLRNKMVQGEWDLPEEGRKTPPGCSPCHSREALSFQSRRQHWMKEKLVQDLWSKSDFFTPQHQAVYHLDIAFNNLCNFKCRMCNSVFSTKWATDEIFLKENGFPVNSRSLGENITDYDIITQLRKIAPRLKTLRRVELVGGEPFINPSFVPFMDLLDELGVKENCEIMITTNGSKIDESILKKIEGFKYVNLNISLDSTGDLFEYMRSASESSWSDIIQRVQVAIDFCALRNADAKATWKINLNGSFQIYNMLNLYEFVSWMISVLGLNERSSKPSKFRNSFEHRLLINPNYLSVFHAPQKMKEASLRQLDQLEKDFPWLESISEARYLRDIRGILTKEPEDLSTTQKCVVDFRRFTELLDKRREQEQISFLKTYNEYLSDT